MSPRFDQRADSYAESAVVQRELAAWLAEWLEPAETLAGLSAIEFGAGDGLFTQRLIERSARVVAVDAAPQMVARGQAHWPQAEWRAGDAWHYAGAPADRLYSASLLQWCNDPAAALGSWRRLLDPGGRMLHGFYAAPTLVEWQSVAPGPPPLSWRTTARWEEEFRTAGWQILRCESRTCEARFASALALLRFFHRTGAAAPRGTGAGALRRALSEYDRRFPHPAGGVRSTWTFFRIEAC